MVDEKVMRLITKTLKLASNNPSAEEAQTALLKAQELMAKHGIEMSQIDIGGETQNPNKKAVSVYAGKRGKLAWWNVNLANIIAKNFRCYCVNNTRKGYNEETNGDCVKLVGLKEDVKLAKELYLYALDVVEYQSKAYIKEKSVSDRSVSNRIQNDYILGFLKGLEDKFKEQVDKNQWGLILVKDALVENLYSTLNVSKSKIKTISSFGDGEARSKGYQDGKSLGNGNQRALKG